MLRDVPRRGSSLLHSGSVDEKVKVELVCGAAAGGGRQRPPGLGPRLAQV